MKETILQFGGGRFLRAFVDLFVQEANDAGQNVGQVVVVQSMGSGRAQWLNANGGRFAVQVRGLEGGRVVDETRQVASVSRALVAAGQWQDVLAVATSLDLRYIVSNTTESGFALNETDKPDSIPPAAFPAKLLLALKARFEAGLPPLTVLPCELVENNAVLLRETVLQQAHSWGWTEAETWLASIAEWRNTLVDRIVTEKQVEVLGAETLALQTFAEPFAFWAVETLPAAAPLFTHPAIHLVIDVTPYRIRKVRILNGAHTALAPKAIAMGFSTVREAVEDPTICAWLNRLLFEEIVPTVENRVEAASEFANQTLERFANPFLDHKLTDIVKDHETKMRIRLEPTRAEFIAQFGKRPVLLDEILGTN